MGGDIRQISTFGGWQLSRFGIGPSIRNRSGSGQTPLAVGPVWTVVRDRVLLARHSDADSILWRHEMIKAHSVLGNGELNPLDDPVELVPVCPVLR